MKKALITLLTAGIVSCATTDFERISRNYDSQTGKYKVSVEENHKEDKCVERIIELNRLPGTGLNVMSEPLGVYHAHLRDLGCDWNIDRWRFNYREDRGVNKSMLTEKIKGIYDNLMKEKQITETVE